MKPAALLVHVPDVQIGLDWYKKAFPNGQCVFLEEFSLNVLDIDGFTLEIIQSDAKVGAGKFGTVLYWSVPILEEAIDRFAVLGARLYRGPMAIEFGLGMCQLEDPFGNLIGLRGKYKDSK